MAITTIILVYALLFLLGISPLLSAFLAEILARRWGCTVHEGSVQTCLRNGKDYGPMLYKMFVLGWASLLTAPLALLVAIVFTVYIMW